MNIKRVSAFSYKNTGGNPAGVLITQDSLSDEKMLEIAKEVNYSETAFLQKLKNNKYRIKYFSPEMQIDFCGHATIASGEILAQEFGLGDYKLVFNNGEITINTESLEGSTVTSINSINTKTEDMDEKLVDEFVSLFNFTKDDLHGDYPIKKSYSGNFHVIIFLKDKKTFENMEYDFAKAQKLVRDNEIVTISIVYKENENLYNSRNAFAYGGVYEDSATGSAAISLGEYLRHTEKKVEGNFTIHQGFDMGMPSEILVSYGSKKGSSIKISGKSRIINK